MRSLLRSGLAVAFVAALVAAWLLPTAAAIGVGMHVAEGHASPHHHHHHDGGPAHHHGDPVDAADDRTSHSHALEAPPHAQRAMRTARIDLGGDTMELPLLPRSPVVPERAEASRRELAREHPPPVPLFTLHCALLS